MSDKYWRKLAGRLWFVLHYGEIRWKQTWAWILYRNECFITSNTACFWSAYMCQQLSFQRSPISHLMRLLWSMTSVIGSCFCLFYWTNARATKFIFLRCPGGYRRRSSSWGHRLSQLSRTLSLSSAVRPAPLSSALDPCLQESPQLATM